MSGVRERERERESASVGRGGWQAAGAAREVVQIGDQALRNRAWICVEGDSRARARLATRTHAVPGGAGSLRSREPGNKRRVGTEGGGGSGGWRGWWLGFSGGAARSTLAGGVGG